MVILVFYNILEYFNVNHPMNDDTETFIKSLIKR